MITKKKNHTHTHTHRVIMATSTSLNTHEYSSPFLGQNEYPAIDI